jgi:hypothetical protein
VSDWAAVASALFAAIGLIFAGRQLLLGNQQVKEDRRLGIDGVVVSWRATGAPAAADDNGFADWTYEVTVGNPGRLPIDHVEIRWIFPCLVRRLHYNGASDPPSTELHLGTPVLPGGDRRQWTRWLRINFEEATALPATYAEVTFTDIEGRRRTNRWPRDRRSSDGH